MNDWTAGYVADVDYVSGFYREQTPAHINTACLVRGVTPPVEPGERFTYCELGCGLGDTAMIIAAANPQAEVWAFDFNPSHIDHARRLARAGGLDNVTFMERSFEELATQPTSELPVFDYITLHGVWSWISPENRQHIVTFIGRHLRPGGAVYVTYNALPGWTSAVPVQRLIATFAETSRGRSDLKVREAIRFVADVAAAADNALDQKLLESLNKQVARGNTQYLAHEYLNGHWTPAFHADVVRDLARAKLTYAATANLIENFRKLCLNERQTEILESLPEPQRETVADYFMTRTFRRDIFIRGSRMLAPRRFDRELQAHRLTLAVPKQFVILNITLPIGQGSLNENFYEPAFVALSEAVRTVGELRRLPEVAGAVPASEEIVGMSVATGQVVSAPNAIEEAGLARIRRFNLAHLKHAASEGRPYLSLACLATGSALTIDLPEMLAYEALVTGTPIERAPLAEAATALLFSRGDRLRTGETQIEDKDETQRLLTESVDAILSQKLPIWRRVGAL